MTDKKKWTEEVEMKGAELVERVKELMNDASVRRVIIRKPNGETLLEVPIMTGAAVAGALALFSPVLAAVGALAALVTEVKVEIVRDREPGTDIAVQENEEESDDVAQ